MGEMAPSRDPVPRVGRRRRVNSGLGCVWILYHWLPRWASVKTEMQPGSVPHSGFGFSIGTNMWLLTGLTPTTWALVPVGKFSIHLFVSASMTPSTGEAVVAVGLVKKSRAPR